MGDTTYCIWREKRESQWHIGNISFPGGDDPDGSAWMLSILDGNPLTYKEWAEQYHERPISADAVKQIYEGATLTPALVRALNLEVEYETVLSDASEIGYPVE